MLLNKYARTHESVSKSLVHVTAITLKLFTKHFSIQRQKKIKPLTLNSCFAKNNPI